MTRTDAKCRVDAVEVGELSVMALGAPLPQLTAKFALTDSASGQRFGAGHRNSDWSSRTAELLAQLIASVEADLVESLFQGAGSPTAGGEGELPPTADGVAGF